jgi:hypothetical protein
MGSVTALGIMDSVLDLETQLLYHLQGNHFPPVPSVMVQPCIDAIDAYYDEDYDRLIDLPMWGDVQILYRDKKQAPASALIAQHHLDFWLPHIMDCTCDDCMVGSE